MALRTRVLLLFLVFAVLPILIVGGADYMQSFRDAGRETETRIASMSERVAGELGLAHAELKLGVAVLAGGQGVRDVLLPPASVPTGPGAVIESPPAGAVAALVAGELQAFREGRGRTVDRVEILGADGAVLHRVEWGPGEAGGVSPGCGDEAPGRVRLEWPVQGPGGARVGAVAAEAPVSALLEDAGWSAGAVPGEALLVVDRRLRVVLNRYHPEDSVTVDDIRSLLDRSVDWTLSNDYRAVIRSANEGEPIVLNGRSPYAADIARIVEELVGARLSGPEETGGKPLRRIFGFLQRK